MAGPRAQMRTRQNLKAPATTPVAPGNLYQMCTTTPPKVYSPPPQKNTHGWHAGADANATDTEDGLGNEPVSSRIMYQLNQICTTNTPKVKCVPCVYQECANSLARRRSNLRGGDENVTDTEEGQVGNDPVSQA